MRNDSGQGSVVSAENAITTGRKTGKWLEKTALDNADYPIDEWQSAKCSVCGKYHTTPYRYSFDDYPYCPNCGSEMKK